MKSLFCFLLKVKFTNEDKSSLFDITQFCLLHFILLFAYWSVLLKPHFLQSDQCTWFSHAHSHIIYIAHSVCVSMFLHLHFSSSHGQTLLSPIYALVSWTQTFFFRVSAFANYTQSQTPHSFCLNSSSPNSPVHHTREGRGDNGRRAEAGKSSVQGSQWQKAKLPEN